MKRLLLACSAAAAIAGPVQAQTLNDRTKILYVFNTPAKSSLGSDSAIRTWIDARIVALNNNLSASGATTRYAPTVAPSNGSIVFNTQNIAFSPPTQATDALGETAVSAASKDIRVADLRDTYGADLVVVVTNASGDADGGTIMDCAKTGAAAAMKGYAGVSLTAGDIDVAMMHTLAKTNCATAAQSYAFIRGTSGSNCSLFRTAGNATTSVTRDIWNVPEGGLSVTPGYSDSTASSANADMVLNCPAANAGNYTYSCQVTAACTIVTATTASCPHNRKQTDTRGLPTCTPGSNGVGGCIVDQAIAGTGTKVPIICSVAGGATVFNLPFLSTPNRAYLNMPMGVTGTNDQVSQVDARFDTSRGLHNYPVAARLKAAALSE